MQHSEDAINIGKDELNHMTQWDNSFIRIEPTDTFGVLNFTETSTTPKGSCPVSGHNPQILNLVLDLVYSVVDK